MSNGNSSLNESATSLQTSFESLSLHTPLQPTASHSAADPSQAAAMAVPTIQTNYDYKGQDEPADVHGIDPSLIDTEGNDESSEGARGSSRWLTSNPSRRRVVFDLEYPQIAVGNMWTRKDIKEFKDALRKEKDTVIKIGSGEAITVSDARVSSET